MKLLFTFITFFAMQSIMAQTTKTLTDSYYELRKLSLDQLDHQLVKDPAELKLFLDNFFRDFTAHQKTKIFKLKGKSECAVDYCYELQLDYYYYSKDKEKNIALQSDLLITLRPNEFIIQIQNHIPSTIKAIVTLTPASWLENFPILKQARISLFQEGINLTMHGEVHTLNEVLVPVLKEFLDDFNSSFYFHLLETVENR